MLQRLCTKFIRLNDEGMSGQETGGKMKERRVRRVKRERKGKEREEIGGEKGGKKRRQTKNID